MSTKRWTRKVSLILALLMTGSLFLMSGPQQATAATMVGGWEEPIPLNQPAAGWLASGCNGTQNYQAGLYHIGRDYWGAVGTSVRAIGEGTVAGNYSFGTGFARAVFVRHKAADNTEFVVLYGHINSDLTANTTIQSGSTIGVLAELTGVGPHLHLGLVPGTSYPSTQWGRLPCPSSGALDHEPFIDPIAFLEAHPKASAPTTTSRMLFARGDDMLFVSDNLGGPWVSETGSGWLHPGTGSGGRIAVGGADGKTHMWVNSCDGLYAKDSLGPGGWTEEASCGTAKSVAISNTGLQMMLSNCGAVYAKYGVAPGGWATQQDCGNFVDVAVGGDTQMMLSGCGAVYAKSSNMNYGGWTEEAPCGTAAAIAISSTGLQMMLSQCGSVYSKYGVGVGGWWTEANCGWATAVAAGGDTHMMLSACGAVHAKTSMGWGGWVEEAICNTATAIAIGSNGRQMMITSDAALYAKDSIGAGGWHFQVGPGNAKAIAVG